MALLGYESWKQEFDLWSDEAKALNGVELNAPKQRFVVFKRVI